VVDGGVVLGMASSMLTPIPTASFTEQKA